jgi:hypothetical protein
LPWCYFRNDAATEWKDLYSYIMCQTSMVEFQWQLQNTIHHICTFLYCKVS